MKKNTISFKAISIRSLAFFGLVATLGFASLSLPVSASVKAGDITGGKKAPHVNIALFHKLHGQEAFKYPQHIASHDILSAVAGKAQFISINHTAGLKDGDVITIANDVLRDDDGAFEDFGVDCQIAIHIKETSVAASGMCEILMVDQDGREIEHKGIIKPAQLESGKDWVLVYNDLEDGIAVYIDEEVNNE